LSLLSSSTIKMLAMTASSKKPAMTMIVVLEPYTLSGVAAMM
jgi:hypothetical protein